MPRSTGDGPLAGIRVLDFSRILAGPLATMVLADLGADVIKIERPGTGDDTRMWGPPFVGDDAAYYLSVNRNKRSIVLDLATPEGAETARRLTATADVVVENFRPGLMARFGLDHGTLAAAHPKIVYCSLLAFGEEESEARPGYDIIVQGMSGLMSVTGERDGRPVKVGVALLDVITGLYAANGIQAALRERDTTGVGRRVSVSLYEASVAAMVNQAANYLLGGMVPGPMGTEHPNIVPYQVFDASDRPFVLAAGNDKLYRLTCEAVGRSELADDARFATNEARVQNRGTLVPLLQEEFAKNSAAHWLEALGSRSVPCAPVARMDEVFASPEGAATVQPLDDPVRGTLDLVANPIRVDGARSGVRLPPPLLGEHTAEILAELE
ncbi:MAG: CoA transferase [Actinobacteria bacterium]|nr:CoA transferase [Actinomycetota bacterium]